MTNDASSGRRSRLVRRLRALPGDLVLALVNATAVLVIAAAILALLAVGQVEQAGARLAGAATDAVFERLDWNPAGLRAELSSLREDLRQVATGAGARTDRIEARLAQDLRRVEAAIDRLNASVAGLEAAGPALAAAAVRQTADAFADAVMRARTCPPAAPPAPD